MLDWTPEYIGVGIVAAFSAVAGSVLGFMYGLSVRLNDERDERQQYDEILHRMEVANEQPVA